MKILFLNGERSGRTIELDPAGTTIGRETDNRIQLLVGGVSRYHANISRRDNGEWFIRDLGSTNGTKVGDKLVTEPTPLRNGDVVSIGDQLLQLMDDAPADAASQQAPTFVFNPTSTVQSVPRNDPPPQDRTKTQDTPHVSTLFVPEDLNDIFSKNGSRKTSKPEDSPDSRRKRVLGNLIFFLIVIVLIGILVWIFLSMKKDGGFGGTTNESTVSQPEKVAPFALYYLQEKISPDSIFRISILLENNDMKVTLDEPANNRHWEGSYSNVSEDLIRRLKDEFSESNFFDLDETEYGSSTGDADRQVVRLMVSNGNNFRDIVVNGRNNAPRSFEKAESIILDTLLQDPKYNLGILFRPVKEILDDANNALIRAEQEFATYKAEPSNLYRAIIDYQIALDRYSLFDPKPKQWNTARKGFAEASALRNELKEEAQKNIQILIKRKLFAEALRECKRILQYYPEDDDTYMKIRRLQLQIEENLY